MIGAVIGAVGATAGGVGASSDAAGTGVDRVDDADEIPTVSPDDDADEIPTVSPDDDVDEVPTVSPVDGADVDGAEVSTVEGFTGTSSAADAETPAALSAAVDASAIAAHRRNVPPDLPPENASDVSDLLVTAAPHPQGNRPTGDQQQCHERCRRRR